MIVLLEGSPIDTEELWSFVRLTIGFLVTSLTKAFLPNVCSSVLELVLSIDLCHVLCGPQEE